MLFSSITFLYYFLPIVVLLYLLLPGKAKNVVLLAGSLFFYAWGEPKYILLMAITIVVGYLSGIFMDGAKSQQGKKAIMIVTVCLCLASLGIFKYADFFVESVNRVSGKDIPLLQLALPIGISFYTFQLISYIVDVCRGTTEAQRNPVKLAVYISMFPQLIAGPIVRYVDVKEKLTTKTISREKISYGMTRFCMGLGKKVLIANTLGELSGVYNHQPEATVLFTWMYGAAITLQIYFDFSGYSDMAIGLGSILGFDFPENFRYPLTSKSATEFWRRWHITLGSWFRDYLYIPMGGSRVKVARHFLNIFVVWMATGFWHGASWNFVIWGLFFAVLLVIEKYGFKNILSKSKVFSQIYLVLAVMISFIIFDNTMMADGLQRVGYLFGAGGISFSSARTLFYLRDYWWILLVACVGATELPRRCVGALKAKWGGKGFGVLEPLFNVALLVLSTAFLINGSFNPFLYFRF